MEGPDYIVSELLSELKEENKRKDTQIKSLHKTLLRVIIMAIVAILIVIGVCFLYLNQYDFASADTISVEKSAEGMYAMVDSDGNIVGYDLPINDNGESDLPVNENEQP